MQKLVSVNAAGQRVGEDHQNAKLTNNEVDRIRELHDERVGYRRLAKMFEVSRETIRDIVKCRRRAQEIAGSRAVCVPEE